LTLRGQRLKKKIAQSRLPKRSEKNNKEGGVMGGRRTYLSGENGRVEKGGDCPLAARKVKVD